MDMCLFQLPHQQPTESATTMNAAALQDHWIRTLGLSNIGPRQVGLGPAARAKQKKVARPVIDTGRSKSKPKPSNKPVEKEYVLDEKLPPLTLAQKLGLVDAPGQHLSEAEWTNAKAKSNARDDSKEPCVICKEDFGLQQQVLLSCSHVFHRACLQAFERYTGKKTCPMCRREQYQTRVIHEGAKEFKLKSVIRIQAAWRGYVVRSWYKKLRQAVPPKDPKLRKKFFIDKLEGITDRMIKSCDFDVNSFLHEIDNSLERSRDIFRHFDAIHRVITEDDWDVIQLKAVERANQECPICLTGLCSEVDKSPPTSSRDRGAGESKGKPLSSPTTAVASLNLTKSQAARQKAGLGKGNKANSKEEGEKEMKKLPKKAAKPRKTVLLSCTHVFHETCLLTLEELAMGDIRNSCPICRAIYQKRVIVM
ncbi:hypothetical protein V1264_008807 [Littorina saxatilis]|uniref:RING-type domain-containing protein n=1 Tax=Littorina saxatilis TaxID=31220 RepID=A0AAN9ATQ4_9CAEN